MAKVNGEVKIQIHTNIQIHANIQTFFSTQLQNNFEFASEYKRFQSLLNVDERYLTGLKVGETKCHLFSNGDAIIYCLVSETFENSIKNYVVEIKQFITNDVCEALNQRQRRFKMYWDILQRGIARADRIEFYVQIAIAICVLSVLFFSKIPSSDLPQRNNRSPVTENHLAPKNKIPTSVSKD